MKYVGFVLAGVLACAFAPDVASAHGIVFSVNPETGYRKNLHKFLGGTDGNTPYSSLINIGNTLYGTTWGGGRCRTKECGSGAGTVFSVDRITRAEKVLYAFTGGADGGNPQAGLIRYGSKLFGTATFGGSGSGVVFDFDVTTGKERVLYAFTGANDGGGPCGKLLLVNGVLYGTTALGGAYGGGVVFAFDLATKTESVVYSFGAKGDGTNPLGALTDVSDTLYGTTSQGGANQYGTVFGVSLSTGAETYLYSFQGGTDGVDPEHSDVVDVGGQLYGITMSGGAGSAGTVFTVNLSSGAESVLYSFGSSQTDGSYPFGDLIESEGTLYGTTTNGGTNTFGTVFSITTSGVEATLHSFRKLAVPEAALLYLHGRLYGTAAE